MEEEISDEEFLENWEGWIGRVEDLHRDQIVLIAKRCFQISKTRGELVENYKSMMEEMIPRVEQLMNSALENVKEGSETAFQLVEKAVRSLEVKDKGFVDEMVEEQKSFIASLSEIIGSIKPEKVLIVGYETSFGTRYETITDPDKIAEFMVRSEEVIAEKMEEPERKKKRSIDWSKVTKDDFELMKNKRWRCNKPSKIMSRAEVDEAKRRGLI